MKQNCFFAVCVWLAAVPYLLARDGSVPAQSSSEATNQISRLPAVVVTATQTEEEPFSLPFSVNVIGPLELERKLPRTTPEALRELPSVMLQKTSHGTRVALFARIHRLPHADVD